MECPRKNILITRIMVLFLIYSNNNCIDKNNENEIYL